MATACGAEDESSAPQSSKSFAEDDTTDSGESRAPAAGVAAPPSGGGLSACEGECREMTLTVHNGSQAVRFDRAQFGFDFGGGYPELHIEARRGGNAECPIAKVNAASDGPSHSLRLAGLPAPFDRSSVTEGSGVEVTLFDLAGDLIGDRTVLRAKSVTLTPSAINLADADAAYLAFDVHIEFERDIVVEGHAFASHCASMDLK